jgi:hypothetical protein
VRTLIVSLLATVALVTGAAGAAAESVAVPDPAGDAPRAVDVTGIRLDNRTHAVRIHLHFADLRRARVRSISSELDAGTALGRGYVLSFERRRSGGFTKQLSWVRLYAEGGSTLPCAGLRLRWTDDRADIRLPRACMSKPHDQRLRVNVTVVSLARKRDRVPDGFVGFSPWVARG